MLSYVDTLGNIVLQCIGEYLTYNNYLKGEPNYGIFVFRNELSINKSVQNDTSLKSFKNQFNPNKIVALKTCFQELYGNSLSNYLNGIDFSKIFEEEDSKR